MTTIKEEKLQETIIKEEENKTSHKIRNHFITRLLMWTLGLNIFVFGLVLIYSSGVGVTTVDFLWQNFRSLLGVPVENYGLWILTPGSILFMFIPSVTMSYIRTKKVPLEYILTLIPTLTIGFLITAFMKIPFVKVMLTNVSREGTEIFNRPLYNLIALGGFLCYAVGLGIISGAKMLSNIFVILIIELSATFNMKFTRVQKILDLTLIILGLTFGIIAVYTNSSFTWDKFFAIFNWIVVVTLLFQGFIIFFFQKKTTVFLMID